MLSTSYVEVYIWKGELSSSRNTCSATNQGHVSLQLFIDGVADPRHYLSFFPKSKSVTDAMKEGKKDKRVLKVIDEGVFNSPNGDNLLYEGVDSNTVAGRHNCDIRRLYDLDINKMANKIEELKKTPSRFRDWGSSLFTLKDHQNCTSMVLDVLNEGGIKKLFAGDQITKTIVSNIMSFLAIVAMNGVLGWGLGLKGSLADNLEWSAGFTVESVFPATIISRAISYLFNLSEPDCFVLSASISNVLANIFLYWHAPMRGFLLVGATSLCTLVVKYLPVLSYELIGRPVDWIKFYLGLKDQFPSSALASPMKDVHAFALGSLLGQLLSGCIISFYFGTTVFFLPEILANLLYVTTLIIASFSGQLLPDALASILDWTLEICKPYLSSNIFTALEEFSNQLKRFSWLVERPNGLDDLLANAEKIETKTAETSKDTSQTSIATFSSFFREKFEYIATRTQPVVALS